MIRIEENGHVSFDPSQELEQAEEYIQNILATLNPNHPNTLERLVGIVSWYGGVIDKAWSSEYSERTNKDAQMGASTTLAAVLAGMQVAKDNAGDN